MKNEYTTPELLKVVGITRARLNQWLERGFVWPSVQKASGQGVKNLYSVADLYRVAAFKHLLEFGFSRKAAGIMIQALRFDGNEHKKYHVLLHTDSKRPELSYLYSFNDKSEMDNSMEGFFSDWVLSADNLFTLNVTNIIGRVNEKIKDLL